MYVSVTMTKQNLTVFFNFETCAIGPDVLMYFISYFIFDSIRLDCIFLSFYSYMSVLHNMEMII